jgi:3-methyl-2-oxobutanoate hydroxymethyltransferase
VINAGEFIRVGCDAVKIEGGKGVAPRVKAMVDAGIVVMGHLGLTPQSTACFGGYRVQGKTLDSFKGILEDALALEEAGISFLLLEAMPAESAGLIAKALSVPVYGIGAGNQVDGTLVIIHDILGMFEWFVPKFIKRYADIGENITDAVRRYSDEVRKRKFPQKENLYPIEKENLRKIEEWYNKRMLKDKKGKQ